MSRSLPPWIRVLAFLACSPMAMAAVTAGVGAPAVLRWDFSATLSVQGLGNGLPGFVEGASFTGSIESADDFSLYYGYQGYLGYLTIYQSPSAVLNYVVTSGGSSYSYSLTGIYAIVTQRDIPNSYRVEFSAPFLQVAKDGFGTQITDPSFETFSTLMTRGLSDGSGHVTVANGHWANANSGPLNGLSMSVIPEPSGLLLGAASIAFSFCFRRRQS